jgi:hypothetical protein
LLRHRPDLFVLGLQLRGACRDAVVQLQGQLQQLRIGPFQFLVGRAQLCGEFLHLFFQRHGQGA